MLQRISSLVKKEFIHLLRDWWLPMFMLLGGASELLLIGWATSRPITNLPMVMLDQDHSRQSRELLTSLENTGTFEFLGWVDGVDEIEESIVKGEIIVAVIIPPGYASEMGRETGKPVISVILNGTESVSAAASLRSIEGVVRVLGEEITYKRLGYSAEDLSGFFPSVRVWFNEGLSEALYTTPAELGLMLEFTVLIFAALSFARERELGTLEQLLVMPFSSMEIIIGKSLPVILVGMTDFLVLLGMVHFAFNVPIRGSLPLLLGLAVVYVIVELGKGLVISVTSRTQHQAFLLVMMWGMVDFMFTGYAAPVESMPQVIQFIAKFIPAHHWMTILRGILLKGSGLDVLWPNVLSLFALGAVIGTVSLYYVRKALN